MSSNTLVAILCSLLGGLAGALITLLSSYLIAKIKIKQEAKLWENEFAVNYSKLLVTDPEAAKLLARQFAVGLIIIKDSDKETISKHFIPYQCKTSIGRHDDNDIILTDPHVSRDHCIIYQRNGNMLIQELSPKNGTYVNSARINKTHILESGDIIQVGGIELNFESLT
ncbi:FHA domain-containing protein [Maridesulfovibrio sp.]|uniref:FHA domain-containing protein n=1 Tax=Maridesulfovibrio sp. TaxID=2795000 RepID=UPI003BAAE514